MEALFDRDESPHAGRGRLRGLDPKPQKRRPYWHVDAKWAVGLALVGLVNASLFVAGFELLTAPSRAVDRLSLAMALSLSPSGLDDPVDIAKMRLELAAAPGHTLQPIKGLNLTIHGSDLEGTPRQVRLRLFRQLAELLYERGPDGLASLATDPEIKRSLAQAAPLVLFTRQTHDQLVPILAILTGASLTLFGLLVFFSHRFGRLLSPGLVLLTAAGPAALLLALVRQGLESIQGTLHPAVGQGTGGQYGYFAHALGPLPLAPFLPGYQLAAAAGLVLMGTAVVSWLGSLVVHRRKQGLAIEAKLGPAKPS